MKKILLTFTLAVVAHFFSAAQDLHFGVQLSPSWSWMETDNTKFYGSGTNLGLKLGVIVENRFSEAYSVTSGIGFHFNTGGSLRLGLPGQIWTSSYDNFDVKPKATDTFPTESRLHYSLQFVEIPIGLKLRTSESGDHIRWFAEPQLTLGFRSGALGDISNANPIVEQNKISIGKEVGIVNLSWGIGAGGEYVISNATALVVGLYFQKGFVDMTSDSGSILYDSSTGATVARPEKSKGTVSSLTLRLGVMF